MASACISLGKQIPNIPIIGICLGAQLIASALGARVYRNADKEIGWWETTSSPNKKNCFHFPNRFLAFHWHGETFDLPPGAIHLARTQGCENQAFQIGRRVIGLQFHLETTDESLQALIANCGDELTAGPYIQSEKELRQVAPAAYTNINAIMSELIAYVTGASS